MKGLILTVLLTLVTLSSANANNGEMLYECLMSDDPNMQAIAESYITGSYEMATTLKVLCFTDGVTHDDVVSIVANYLHDFPTVRYEQASVVIGASLIRYFPCKEN